MRPNSDFNKCRPRVRAAPFFCSKEKNNMRKKFLFVRLMLFIPT